MFILAIGDIHIRTNNARDIEQFTNKILEIVRDRKPDIIIVLGDIMHYHERLHTSCLNRALYLFDEFRKNCPLYIIVGNHDYTDCDQFLTDNHWMNALKMWENTTVVDRPYKFDIQGLKLTMCPFVKPGRFIEALDIIQNWRDSILIFCHQEFKSCFYGGCVSEDGDVWDPDLPQIVSGHIHEKQIVGENIYYPGASVPTSFGETHDPIVLMIETEGNEFEFEEIDLDLTRKVTVKFNDLNELKKFIPNPNHDTRLVLECDRESFNKFKKSAKYRRLIERGVCIAHRSIKLSVQKGKPNPNPVSFRQALDRLVKRSKNKYIRSEYKRLKEDCKTH